MRIGLFRHFPVLEPIPSGWRNAAELDTWRNRYDASETRPGPFNLGGIHWQACVASDLPRAAFTARSVFNGPIELTPLLREAEFATLGSGNLRLPVRAWIWWLQLAWAIGHPSQRACRDAFRHRVRHMTDRFLATDRDTLVVCHAGTIIHLAKALRRHGYSGPRFTLPRHAHAYVFSPPT